MLSAPAHIPATRRHRLARRVRPGRDPEIDVPADERRQIAPLGQTHQRHQPADAIRFGSENDAESHDAA
jgi:hypothetical protein